MRKLKSLATKVALLNFNNIEDINLTSNLPNKNIKLVIQVNNKPAFLKYAVLYPNYDMGGELMGYSALTVVKPLSKSAERYFKSLSV